MSHMLCQESLHFRIKQVILVKRSTLSIRSKTWHITPMYLQPGKAAQTMVLCTMRFHGPHLCALFLLLYLISSTVGSSTTSFKLPSGRAVLLAHLSQAGLPVSVDSLRFRVFEQIDTQSIRSHFIDLNISLIAPNSEDQVNTHNQVITVRFGQAYTFVYNSTSSTLVSGWGPGIQLEPIDSIRYPGLFINNAALLHSDQHKDFRKTSTAITQHALSQPTLRQQNSDSYASNVYCNRFYYIQLAAVFDQEFYDVYKDDVPTFLYGLSRHVNSVFENSVCIRFSFLSYVLSAQGTYPSPNELKSCSQNKRCDAPRKMLQLLYNRPLGQPQWNGGDVLLTKYGDGTTLGGAAYHASMCNNFRNYGWVIQSSPQVLVHELGHLLGAPHSKQGIMKGVIDVNEPLLLSKKSQAAIARFIRQESLSWCLRRRLTGGKIYLKDYDGWLNSISYIIPSFQTFEHKIMDTTVANLFSNNSTDMITMYMTEWLNSKVLTFNVAYNVNIYHDKCEPQVMYSPIRGSNEANETTPAVHLRFSKQSFAFTVSFGHFTYSNSKDLVMTWIQNSVKGMYTYYRIYYDIPPYVAPLTSLNQSTFFTRDEPAEKILCASSTVGHVKRLDSNDLLHVHIEQRKGRSVAYYKLFFDIQSDGRSLGGRSRKVHIPGWFGRETSSVNIALHDLDKNGQPEIIMYHKDETERMKRGFVRIGRNLDSDGIITGGWSDFVEMGRDTTGLTADGKYEDNIYYGTTMDVTNIGNKDNTIIALSLDYGIEKKELRLECGNQVLTNELLSTCTNRIESEVVDNGCDECYRGHKKRTKCRKEIELCQSVIDNVHFSNSMTVSTARQFEADKETVPKNPQKNGSPVFEPDVRSLYCLGFHHLQIEKGECLTIDRELVVAEGLRKSLLNEMRPLNGSLIEHVESEVFDEVYGGTNGHYLRPVVVQFKLTSKKKVYSKILRNVFQRIRRRYGFQHNNGNNIVRTTFWKNGELFVHFKLTRNHVSEI